MERRSAKAACISRRRRVLVKGSLWRHSVVVGLTIHAFAKRSIASSLVTTELVHVVSIIGAAIVRMVVSVATMLTLLAVAHVSL